MVRHKDDQKNLSQGDQKLKEKCTGLTARWCPIHGDCTCPERPDGDWDGSDDCPLHGLDSDHGEKIECPWPHHVTSPICVYDMDSYQKYRDGTYKVPERCICGEKLTYEKPVCVCLVERGQMTGDMLMTVECPVKFINWTKENEG